MPYKIGLSEKRRKLLEKELAVIIPRIINCGVKKIILIGSLAKGEIQKTSDIDLIIIKETQEKYMKRLDEIYSSIRNCVAVDIFVYTPAEFEEMANKNIFLRSALKYGRVLYEE